MITAREALLLPGAALSVEEMDAADHLENEVEVYIRKFMAPRGLEFETHEVRPNIISEVVTRLRLAGWSVEFQAMIEQHRLNQAVRKHVGWKFMFAPSDSAQSEHRQLSGIGPRNGTSLCANPKHDSHCCLSRL